MTTESKFVRTQDRTYFNIHKPIRLSYDDNFVNMNNKVSLAASGLDMNNDIPPTRRPDPLPTDEANRQMGSGRYGRFEKPIGTISTMPVKGEMRGFGMNNNFDPSKNAPINKMYIGLPSHQFHSPVMNKIHFPLQHGGSYASHRHHGGATQTQNPAINNWKPGTRIPEPSRVFEYSTTSQVHSQPVDPIHNRPNRGHLIQGRLSSDDGKSISSTQKYYNNPVGHVSHNPLIVR